MRNRSNISYSMIRLTVCAFLMTAASCSFLEVDLPKSLVSEETAFSDDIMASSVAMGMYTNLMGSGSFASGSSKSITALTGLSSDELSNYYSTSTDYIQLEENTLQSNNSNALSIWSSAYKSIYDANIVIEGLKSAPGVTKSVSNQLQGEALFIRAFCHFYLVNLFGDVPLITTTDYRKNSIGGRVSTTTVYGQIIEDLIAAEGLLSENYGDLGRLRVNKAVAQAMLARVYLFTGDWERAEAKASKLIDNTASYRLATNPDQVFLADSKEAIWQLALPDNSGRSTHEGAYFIIESIGHLNFNRIILKPGFINTFEQNDKRLTWVGSFNTGTETVYFPYKYKLRIPSSMSKEYSIAFRLAEQYLIRAEARAKRNNLSGSIQDLDMIRARAALPLIASTNPAIGQEQLLSVIEHERQVELFTEWGHRWLDLIRTNRANAVFGNVKFSWDKNDILYPIPQSEINKNPALNPQNQGY